MADNLAPAPRSGSKPGENALGGVGAPPGTAAAAPTPASNQTGTGLCAAINAYYADQARKRGFIPDVYEIRFADPLLENASMIPPGPIEKEFTGTTPLTSAAGKLDPGKQSSPLQVRTRGATAGQQIVQFIDQVMRSSRYVGDQQNVIWNTKTNLWDPAPSKPGQVFAWYNIVSYAIPLQYDPARNDFAYRLIYLVTPYQTPVQSEYFSSGVFRGVHKIYNYWFTGQNTQVLQYEQSFNSLWHQAITGATEKIKKQLDTSTFLFKKSYLPASNQTRQGGTGQTFEPGANAADILYTQDYAKIKLNIIGDPAWIPSVVPLTSGKFVVSPFNPDGSINTTASVPYFKFAWNRPTDYNLNTGLMDPSTNNYRTNLVESAGDAQESVAYIAFKSRSSFKAGKFTQEIEGTAYFNTDTTSGVSDVGRNTNPSAISTLTNSGGNTSTFIRPLQAGTQTAVNAVISDVTNVIYTQVANSITSISNATLRTPVPPVSIVATVGQTTEFGGLESPPTLAVKPGETAVGGIVTPVPTQGIVQDDEGP